MTSGMFGALIVEGDFDGVPEIAAAAERVLILNEVLFDYRGQLETYDTLWPEAVPRFLAVNGQREPVIRMRPGEGSTTQVRPPRSCCPDGGCCGMEGCSPLGS